MDNQENEEKQNANIAKQAGDAAKQLAKEQIKKAAKEAGKKVGKQILTKIIIPALPYIIGIVIAVLVVCVIEGGISSIGDAIGSLFGGNSSTSSNITDNTQSMIRLNDSGMLATTDEELLETINANLEALNIRKEDLRMGSESDVDQYLCNFMKASLSTQLPYIPGGTGNVQGLVKIQKRDKNGNIENLNFKRYQDFSNLIENNDISADNYFSIDGSLMLCVSKSSKQTVTNPDGTTEVTNDVSEVKIPYRSMVAPYGIPFRFLMTLETTTGNPEYVQKVVDLIRNSGEIILTIFESTQTTTSENIYKYDMMKKWQEEVEVEVEVEVEGQAPASDANGNAGSDVTAGVTDAFTNIINNNENTNNNNSNNSNNNRRPSINHSNQNNREQIVRTVTDRSGSAGATIQGIINSQINNNGNGEQSSRPTAGITDAIGNIIESNIGEGNNSGQQQETHTEIRTETRTEIKREQENDEPITETTITVNEINTITANVTRVNLWVINQTTEYNIMNNTEYPYGEEGITTELPDEEEPELIPPATEVRWQINRSETTKQTQETATWEQGTSETNIDKDGKFMGLLKNSNGTYDQNAEYDPNGREVRYRLPERNIWEAPAENLYSSQELLYYILEQSEDTQKHATIMRYLLNYYFTGNAGEIDFSIFNSTGFTNTSYNGTGFDVHDPNLFITDEATLRMAFSGGYSASEKLVENVQNFLNMQQTYQVNAIFAAAVSITETGAGRTGNAIAYTGGTNPRNGRAWEAVGSYDGERWNNWFNVKTSSRTHYGLLYNGEGESHYTIYPSVAEAISAFANNIANGSYYYRVGKYTVEDIGRVYCPASSAYPTQDVDWIQDTMANISRFYNAAGIDISTVGEVVRYYQQDYESVAYGSSNLSRSGCGPTSFAMVASHLTRTSLTPPDVILGGYYYISGVGTSWSYFAAAARQFIPNCEVVQTSDFNLVKEALTSGNLVISSQDPGLFTRGGHFIVLTKMVDGLIYVNDPNKYNSIDRNYNNRGFTESEVDSTAKQYWIFK